MVVIFSSVNIYVIVVVLLVIYLLLIAEYVCGLTTAQAEVDVIKQIVAPGFPTNYPNHYVYCSYIITAPKSTIIRFWFTRIGYLYKSSTRFRIEVRKDWSTRSTVCNMQSLIVHVVL